MDSRRMVITEDLFNKYDELKKMLQGFGSVAVSFSGGVDSTFLLYAAKEALGENAIAVTVRSHSFPKREFGEAKALCESLGVRQLICEVDELEIEGFSQNPRNRCYLCKHKIFEKIREIAEREKITVIAEGSNLDDNGDYRPGLRAIEELGIQSPLRSIGFTKKEIRELSAYFKLPTWDKPSMACLSSRFVYGETITKEKLEMVEKAEQLLKDLGFRQVRVRIHGDVARIEILPEEFEKMLSEDIRNRITASFKSYGFGYVTMDLTGYRTGSMNEVILKG